MGRSELHENIGIFTTFDRLSKQMKQERCYQAILLQYSSCNITFFNIILIFTHDLKTNKNMQIHFHELLQDILANPRKYDSSNSPIYKAYFEHLNNFVKCIINFHSILKKRTKRIWG